ncbi:MAG: hypothetical protein ACOCXA_08415 [Planctomycetota bacterium]
MRQNLCILTLSILAGPLLAAIGDEDYSFKQVRITDVIDRLTEDGDIDVVYADSLLGEESITITLKLDDVQPLEALQAEVQAAGLRLERGAAGIQIVRPSLRQELQDILRRLELIEDSLRQELDRR